MRKALIMDRSGSKSYIFYAIFGMLSYSYIRDTAREPAYSENNLNFYKHLTLSKKVFLVLNIYIIMPLGTTRGENLFLE